MPILEGSWSKTRVYGHVCTGWENTEPCAQQVNYLLHGPWIADCHEARNLALVLSTISGEVVI